METLVITGAYGLVGTAICNILERDYPHIELYKVKCDDLSDIPYEVDYIIHAAGYGQPLKFSLDKIKTIEINTRGTARLLSSLKSDGKFVFVSTSEVYSGAPSPHKETDIGTTTPQHPRACYIEGKRCGEAICMAYREMGFKVKIARLALAYGPGTKKGDARVINQFIEKALTKGEITMLDKGESRRTYCYVDDAAELIIDILFRGKKDVYNVGGFSEESIRELADTIGFMTKANVTLGEKTLEGSPDSVKLDMTRTLEEFPRSFTSMYTGLIRTIDYQKKLYGITN